MTKQLTMTQIAFQLGANDRIGRDATTPIAKVYAKADAEQQAQMRRDWMINYMAGNLNITEVKAEKIIDTPRTERNDAQQQSHDRARQQFRYHIQRDAANAADDQTISKVWTKIADDLAAARKVAKALDAKSQVAFERDLRALIAQYAE